MLVWSSVQLNLKTWGSLAIHPSIFYHILLSSRIDLSTPIYLPAHTSISSPNATHPLTLLIRFIHLSTHPSLFSATYPHYLSIQLLPSRRPYHTYHPHIHPFSHSPIDHLLPIQLPSSTPLLQPFLTHQRTLSTHPFPLTHPPIHPPTDRFT